MRYSATRQEQPQQTVVHTHSQTAVANPTAVANTTAVVNTPVHLQIGGPHSHLNCRRCRSLRDLGGVPRACPSCMVCMVSTCCHMLVCSLHDMGGVLRACPSSTVSIGRSEILNKTQTSVSKVCVEGWRALRSSWLSSGKGPESLPKLHGLHGEH